MGFFGGLITLQAVIVLIAVAALAGFLFGVGLTGYAIKKEVPEAIELIDRRLKEHKEKKECKTDSDENFKLAISSHFHMGTEKPKTT